MRASEVLGALFCGLGLFFVGMKLLGQQTKQMAGRRLRLFVSRMTGSRALTAGWGLLAGAFLQSTSAVTFIVASLVSARLLAIRTALSLVTWSNVGNSALVLLAVLDIKLLVLYLLGITGLLFQLDVERYPRIRNAAGALLGIGLVFLGMDLMKGAVGPLSRMEGLRQLSQFAQHSLLLMLVLGAVLTFVAQSSTTVAIVAITMARAGLLGVDQTMMFIYGSNMGSGLSTLFLSSTLHGSAKQVSLFQSVLKIAGGVLLAPLLFLEIRTGIPLMKAALGALSSEVGSQMAYLFLAAQLVSALVVGLLSGPIVRFLEKLAPESHEEVLSKPQFLYDEALEEPETALSLVDSELRRVIGHLPDYLNPVREETRAGTFIPVEALHRSSVAILAEIDAFVTELMDRSVARASLERSLGVRNLASLVSSLDESVYEWVGLLCEGDGFKESGSELASSLAEGLHLALVTVCDTMDAPDEMGLRMLTIITSDRGEMMEEARKSFVRDEALAVSPEEQKSLYSLTSTFERIFWILRRISLALAGRAEAQAAEAAR